jgi:predicted RNase H-like HicB family nuclease
MLQYKIIIYWREEDQAFIAEVPELSGCAADGSTYKEALQNVEVVMQEWIETAKELKRSIPEPTQHIISTESLQTEASQSVIENSSVKINP